MVFQPQDACLTGGLDERAGLSKSEAQLYDEKSHRILPADKHLFDARLMNILWKQVARQPSCRPRAGAFI